MFCPSCGSQYESPPRYCKSCGANLAGVSTALSGQSAEMATIQEKYLRRILRGGIFSLFSVLAILWIIAFAVGQIKGDDFVPFASVLTWIASAIFLANMALARHWKKVEILMLNQPRVGSAQLADHQPTLDVLPDASRQSPPFSVVERTTELLPEETRQEDKRSKQA